jgi:hypothetical protein
MHQVTVACKGLTDAEGREAVGCVHAEFMHRPCHTAVRCEWSAGVLRLSATNDYDVDGQALLDEFGDAIHACIDYAQEIHPLVESVV